MQLVIASLDDEAAATLEGLLPMDKMEVVRPAETGLVMTTAIDAFQTDFYLGEMVVTQAELAYKGTGGYAMLAGEDGRRTLLAAAVEAVMQRQDEPLSSRIAGFLEEQAQRGAAEQAAERKMIAATRVAFETMNPG